MMLTDYNQEGKDNLDKAVVNLLRLQERNLASLSKTPTAAEASYVVKTLPICAGLSHDGEYCKWQSWLNRSWWLYTTGRSSPVPPLLERCEGLAHDGK
jgi:hypothetical protein